MSQDSKPSFARLFLASLLPRELQESLGRFQDACRWPAGASRVTPDKFHLTWHFLGPVDTRQIPVLSSALTVPFKPFQIDFNRLALWPPGVLVLEPTQMPPQALALHEALRQRLESLSFVTEQRKFRPHVTLGRNSLGTVWPVSGPETVWEIDHYALMASPHPSTGPYKLLHLYPCET